VTAETGICSYYGGQFNGRKTASGQIFNQNLMTAAHKSLPFFTRIRVRNHSNGKTVDVVVNDRGPFTPGRIVDLSQGAFSKVESTSKGLFKCSWTRA